MPYPYTQVQGRINLGCCLSSPDYKSMLPEDLVPKSCLHFAHVVPVSAATGLGIEELKVRIRESLDQQAAAQTEQERQQRIEGLRGMRPPPPRGRSRGPRPSA